MVEDFGVGFEEGGVFSAVGVVGLDEVAVETFYSDSNPFPGGHVAAHEGEEGDGVLFEMGVDIGGVGFDGECEDFFDGDVGDGEKLVPRVVDLNFGGIAVPTDGLEEGDFGVGLPVFGGDEGVVRFDEEAAYGAGFVGDGEVGLFGKVLE